MATSSVSDSPRSSSTPVSRPATPSTPSSSAAPNPAAASTAQSKEPVDSFQPSSQTRSAWLTGQLADGGGNLLILDQHVPTPIPGPVGAATHLASHGDSVIQTARSEGYQGNVVKMEINQALSDSELQQRYGKATELWTNGKTPEDFQQGIYERGLASQVRLLDDSSRGLNDMTEAGTRNSVANLSLGGSQASTVDTLLKGMLNLSPDDPAAVANMQEERRKFATAYGVNPADLSSQDATVKAAAYQQILQGVVGTVGQTQGDPRLLEAKGQYDGAVTRFEGNNNSVVVAAGNEGNYEKMWESRVPGVDLQVPADWTKNYLSNEAVTTVGALRTYSEGPYPAEYTSNYKGVDVYASGYAPDYPNTNQEGTSVAAPRVSAAMAGIHAKFPNLNSKAVENLMNQQLTGQLGNYWGNETAPVLDDQHTLDFLKSGTF